MTERDAGFFAFIREAQERAEREQPSQFEQQAQAFIRALSDDTDDRRAKIEQLAIHGATEGERAAARAALARIDQDDDVQTAQDIQDEADYEDALMHGEA